MPQPPDIQGYEVVTDTLAVVNQVTASLTINAPSGKRVIGGGANIGADSGGTFRFALTGSRPVGGETGWRADVRSFDLTQESGDLSAWALCAFVD